MEDMVEERMEDIVSDSDDGPMGESDDYDTDDDFHEAMIQCFNAACITLVHHRCFAYG